MHPDIEWHPLSAAQERSWLLDRLMGGRPIQQTAFQLTLQGPLEVGALQRAMTVLHQRHRILDCRFRLADWGLVQEVARESRPWMARVDLSALPPEQRRWEEERLVVLESRRPFPLSFGPPVRCLLLTLQREVHRLLLTGHQIGLDRTSFYVLISELSGHYNHQLGQGEDPPAPGLQFLEVALWQRRWVRELAASLLYWRRRLADLPEPLALPSDRPRKENPSGRTGRYHFNLSPALGSAVANLARASQNSPTTVLLTALVAWLHRLSGTLDLAVGLPVSGRRRQGTQCVPGPFEGALVLRSRLDGAEEDGDPLERITGRGLLARIGITLEEAREHQAVPFAHLLNTLSLSRDGSHHPLFLVRLEVVEEEGEATRRPCPPPSFQDLRWDLTEVDVGHSSLDLDLRLEAGVEGGYIGTLRFARDLFDPATAQCMANAYEATVIELVTHPDKVLAQMEIPPSTCDTVALTRAPSRPSAPPPPVPERHREEIRTAIRAAWRVELELSEFGDQDDFFLLGGTSLALVRVQERLQRRLGKLLPLGTLYRHSTVAGLTEVLAQDPDLAPRPAPVVDRIAQQRAARRRRRRPRNSLHSWR